jgi:hypothetical protein
MSFKFFRGKIIELVDLEPLQMATLRIGNNAHVNNEYCFQFDDEEPFVFTNSNGNLTFTITPSGGGNIEFNNNGRRFKLFARERQ